MRRPRHGRRPTGGTTPRRPQSSDPVGRHHRNQREVDHGHHPASSSQRRNRSVRTDRWHPRGRRSGTVSRLVDHAAGVRSEPDPRTHGSQRMHACGHGGLQSRTRSRSRPLPVVPRCDLHQSLRRPSRLARRHGPVRHRQATVVRHAARPRRGRRERRGQPFRLHGPGRTLPGDRGGGRINRPMRLPRGASRRIPGQIRGAVGDDGRHRGRASAGRTPQPPERSSGRHHGSATGCAAGTHRRASCDMSVPSWSPRTHSLAAGIVPGIRRFRPYRRSPRLDPHQPAEGHRSRTPSRDRVRLRRGPGRHQTAPHGGGGGGILRLGHHHQ